MLGYVSFGCNGSPNNTNNSNNSIFMLLLDAQTWQAATYGTGPAQGAWLFANGMPISCNRITAITLITLFFPVGVCQWIFHGILQTACRQWLYPFCLAGKMADWQQWHCHFPLGLIPCHMAASGSAAISLQSCSLAVTWQLWQQWQHFQAPVGMHCMGLLWQDGSIPSGMEGLPRAQPYIRKAAWHTQTAFPGFQPDHIFYSSSYSSSSSSYSSSSSQSIMPISIKIF